MRYHFYVTTKEAWNAIFDAAKKAKQSIYWETYILHDDPDTYKFLAILKEKAEQGVKIHGIIDSIGAFSVSSQTINDLRWSGIEILFFNRLLPWWNPYRFKRWWFLRTHRKILIIDEKIVFMRGVNISARYQSWIDLHNRLTGVIVRHFLKTFAKVYKICGGQDEKILRWRHYKKTKEKFRKTKT